MTAMPPLVSQREPTKSEVLPASHESATMASGVQINKRPACSGLRPSTISKKLTRRRSTRDGGSREKSSVGVGVRATSRGRRASSVVLGGRVRRPTRALLLATILASNRWARKTMVRARQDARRRSGSTPIEHVFCAAAIPVHFE